MRRKCVWKGVLLVGLVLALVTSHGTAWAQSNTTGAIAGTVRDSTGGVLPGVTVEASSPALIEKVRSVVSDDQGNYKIIDLRPGTYTVTFTLAGFGTFRREGIELTTGFTATANADMRVGALEETVTVTGASPVVDVQNIRQQAVISSEILQSIPSGKTINAFAMLIPGAVIAPYHMDVGGNRGEIATSFGVHGSRGGDSQVYLDGFYVANTGGKNWGFNTLSAQEVAIQTDNASAEVSRGGPQINYIPKEGSNRFTLMGVGNYTNDALQMENLTEELKARGLPFATPVKYVYEYGATAGGYIKQDKLWFFSGNRWWGNKQTYGGVSGGFFNAAQGSLLYVPDLSRPGYQQRWNQDNNLRLTYQAHPKHKFSVVGHYQDNCSCFANVENASSTTGVSYAAPESSGLQYQKPTNIFAVTWNNPASNRFLLEGGFQYFINDVWVSPPPEVKPDHIQVTEQSTGLRYHARAEVGGQGYTKRQRYTNNAKGSVSYITGSHALKAGISAVFLSYQVNPKINGDVAYTFNNQRPVSVTLFATPYRTDLKVKPEIGLYAQDQWTIRKLTLNAGVRFDWLKAYSAGYSLPAGRWVPARDFPRVDNIPNWKDLSPRLGVAYDLFGNGKTAIKAALGRFVQDETTGVAGSNAPANTYVNSATRTWADANGDLVPQESELGPISNANFGKSVVTATWDPDLLSGWGKRGYNWEITSALQHELKPGLGLAVSYYRRWFGNFRVTDNTLISPADFDTYCITAPRDARLPNGGGYQVCGLYDIRPAAFPLNQTVTTLSNNQTEEFNGFDVSLNQRFAGGGQLSAAVSTGQTVTDTCAELIDSPQKQFCSTTNPFSNQVQLKVNGVYPLPWDTQISGTLQNLSGLTQTASYAVPNALIAPSLGRNLGACGTRPTCTSTAVIELVEPFTQFEPRITQVDVRLTKIIRIGASRLQGQFDVYNLFNASPVTSIVSRFGPAYLQPSTVLGARLFKFGFEYNF